MGYEGQIAGLGRRSARAAGPGPADPRQSRTVRPAELRGRRTEAVRLIQALTSLEFVNGRRQPAAWRRPRGTSPVTELTAGLGAGRAPTLFDAYPPLLKTPRPRAAVCPARGAPARPAHCHLCSPAATWASGTRYPGPAAAAVPAGRPDPDRRPRGAGEVQTPVRGAAADRPAPPATASGLRHAKAGELAERFTPTTTCSAGDQVTAVPTYRGRGPVASAEAVAIFFIPNGTVVPAPAQRFSNRSGALGVVRGRRGSPSRSLID